MKTLYLLPNVLHEEGKLDFISPAIDAIIAESEKGARAFLKRFSLGHLPIYLLNEHTRDLKELLDLREEKIGLISDCGLPCLADPGADFVQHARKKGVEIHAFPGPSSIFLALMLSGMSAQAFTFHGYLERDSDKLLKQIRAFSKGMTHIFIEAPYRNQRLLEHLLKALESKDRLCVAWDLTGPDQGVISETVEKWKTLHLPNKKPAVFVLEKDSVR